MISPAEHMASEAEANNPSAMETGEEGGRSPLPPIPKAGGSSDWP